MALWPSTITVIYRCCVFYGISQWRICLVTGCVWPKTGTYIQTQTHTHTDWLVGVCHSIWQLSTGVEHRVTCSNTTTVRYTWVGSHFPCTCRSRTNDQSIGNYCHSFIASYQNTSDASVGGCLTSRKFTLS